MIKYKKLITLRYLGLFESILFIDDNLPTNTLAVDWNLHKTCPTTDEALMISLTLNIYYLLLNKNLKL